MSIDPSIPLGVRPAQFNLGDFLSGMQGVQQMRQQAQQGRLYSLKLKEAEDEQRDHDAINATVPQFVGPDGQPDFIGAAGKLEADGHVLAAQKLRTFAGKQQEQAIDNAKKALDAERAKYEVIDTRGGAAYNELAGTLKDPSRYASARANVIKLMGPEVASYLPEKHDPAAIKTAMSWWENTKPAIATRQQLIADIKDNAFVEKSDREKHDYWTKTLGTWLGTTGNDVQDRVATLAKAKEMGVPAAVIAQFGDPQDPNFLKRAAVFAMGPDKVADNERQIASDKETAKQHGIQNQLEGARIDIQRKQANEKADNAKDIAASIVAGDQPPDLSKLYGMGGLVRGELARAGYDLTRATEDWQSTQKYLSTLNGPAQVRLRQAVDFTAESLNGVEDLAKQWRSSGLGPFSKARLKLAEGGALGENAQSLATRFQAQVSDVVSELATVYKGGNSSTDEGLKLAASNLQTDWSEKALLDNVKQIRTNLGYRRNSMRSAGAVSGSGANPYAPRPDTSAAGAAPATAPKKNPFR